MSTYTESESIALSISSIVLSSLSLIACVFIIICWILFKELRKLAYGFVFYMAIATSIRTLAKMIGGNFEQGDIMCAIQGFLITYGGLSAFYWILSIAIMMYCIIFYPMWWARDSQRVSKCNKLSLLINWTLPFLFASLPLFAGDYTNTGGWCWISNKGVKGKLFRWISYYGQLVLILIFCIFVYIRIYTYLECSEKGSHLKLKGTNKLFNRIKRYPLCLILGFTVAVIRRFVGLWDIQLGFGWAITQSITTGLFGVMLFIAYGRLEKLNKLFRKNYPCCISFCDHCCCCLHRTEDGEEVKEKNINQKELEVVTNTATSNNLSVPKDDSDIMQLSGSTENVLEETTRLKSTK
eukprot:212124_1